MKRSKIIKIIADTICHDPFAYSPKWKWKAFPKIVKSEYERIKPILKIWESKGFIKLLNDDDEYIFITYPDKLPNRKKLLVENVDEFERMKRIINYLYNLIKHDFGFYNPKWKWDLLPNDIKDNYDLIEHKLLEWQEKGYIKILIENDEKFIEIISVPEER